MCLKYFGKRSLANSGGFQTTKLLLVELQETIASLDGSSTMSYVLLRNGGGALVLGMGAGAGVCVPPPEPLLLTPSMSRVDLPTDKNLKFRKKKRNRNGEKIMAI